MKQIIKRDMDYSKVYLQKKKYSQLPTKLGGFGGLDWSGGKA